MSNFIKTHGDSIVIVMNVIAAWVCCYGIFTVDTSVEGNIYRIFSLLMAICMTIAGLYGCVANIREKKENC